MRKVRQGNDKRILWAILRQSSPESFEDAVNMRCFLEHSSFPVIRTNLSFDVIGNVIDAYVMAEQLPRLGDWRIFLHYEKSNPDRPQGYEPFEIDAFAFKQVQYTEEEGGTDSTGLSVETVSLTSVLDRAKDGIDGATFTPTVQKVDDNTIRLYWTNNKGLPNPNDIIFYSNMTYENGNLTINYGIDS